MRRNLDDRRFVDGVVMTVLCFTAFHAMTVNAQNHKTTRLSDPSVIHLPAPAYKGKTSLEEALKNRQSVRNFSVGSLTTKELSQLLWAAQGKTRDWGARTAPSAGAMFPLELYVVMKEGVFRYASGEHRLLRLVASDVRSQLASAALGQKSVQKAPAVFVIAAVYERTSEKYGTRAERYVKMEAGHAGQNLLLQAAALGLAAVPIGAFHDEKVRQALNLPARHQPLYLMPVGRK